MPKKLKLAKTGFRVQDKKVVNGPYLDEFWDFAHVSMLQSHLRDTSFVLQVWNLDYHEYFLSYGQY